MFEEEIAEYTGSPYAVALDNCTDALFLCCTYLNVTEVTIPKKTYLSVPQAIMASGGKLSFDDTEWVGLYQLKPYPIYDSARRFTSDMYIPNSFMCLSFHPKKILKSVNKFDMEAAAAADERQKKLQVCRYIEHITPSLPVPNAHVNNAKGSS